MSTIHKFNKDKFFNKIDHEISAYGVIGREEYKVLGENVLRVVTDFTSSGELTVQARIKFSDNWENTVLSC